MAPADRDNEDGLLARASLILSLRASGVMNTDVLRAFENTPHEVFVPEEFAAYAYKDAALPIGEGQSLTSPWVLAPLIELLDAPGTGRALLIGTGTGYSSALLSRLSRRVFSVERHPCLLEAAKQRWSTIGVNNVIGFHADGMAGLIQQQPFDRILLTGCVDTIPRFIEQQLAEDGVLVAAIGEANGRQTVTRIVRGPSTSIVTEHGSARLPPLMRGKIRVS